jgi:hypothetical protein
MEMKGTTQMNKDAEDEAFDELAKRQGSWGGGFPAKRQMAADKLHWSDCAVHNAPAYPAGPCDCGVAQEPLIDRLRKTASKGVSVWGDLMLEAADALAQPVQEPVAQWLEDAFREGWESYRDSEFASKITENWAFGNSIANGRMIDLQQNTAPPLPVQPERQPLTDEEILHRVDTHVGIPSLRYPLNNSDWINFVRAIEAAHNIGAKP